MRTNDQDRLRATLGPWRRHDAGTGKGAAFTSNSVRVLRQLCEGAAVPHEDKNLLAQRWPKLRKRLEDLAVGAAPAFQRVIPQHKGTGKYDEKGLNAWRLDLPPGHIRLVP